MGLPLITPEIHLPVSACQAAAAWLRPAQLHTRLLAAAEMTEILHKASLPNPAIRKQLTLPLQLRQALQ
jgi:hypothetical protein